MMRYAGKVAMVTGGGNGIGRATVLRLASESAAVVIMDLRSADGEAVAKSISDSGGRALFVAGDAAVEADVGEAGWQ